MVRGGLLLLMLLASSLQAEIIYMKDGRIVEGSILSQNDQFLDVKTDKGTQRLYKATIRRIAYHTAEEKAKLEAERKARREAAMKELERLRLLRAQEEEARRRADLAKQAELARQRAAAAKAVRESVERQEIEKPDEIIGYADFAWRSALVPGWGHFAIGRPIVGGIYATATAGALYGVYETRKRAIAAKDQNHNDVNINLLVAMSPVDIPLPLRLAYGFDANRRAFIDYKARINRYNYALGILANVYAIQLAHIIFNGITWESGLVVDSGQKPTFDLSVSERPADRVAGLPPDHQIQASLNIPF